MRGTGALAGAKIWAAIGLTFVVALFAAAPASMAAPPAPHVDHHITATGVPDHFATVDHEHIAPAAIPGAPDALADALVPRVRTVLLALGLIFAVALLGGMSTAAEDSRRAGPTPNPRPCFPGPGCAGPALHLSPLIG